MSRATALVSVAQQLAVSAGVALGALAVELTVQFKGGGALEASDFPPAFLAVAAISAFSVFIFMRLPPDAGAEIADRMPAPTEASDQRVRLTTRSICKLNQALTIFSTLTSHRPRYVRAG